MVGGGGAASKLSPESELLCLGEEGLWNRQVAGWAPSADFLSQACSRPSELAVIMDHDCSPCPSLPWPLSQVPALCPSLPQALLARLKPCLSPELGNCEPHASGVHRTSASAVPLLGAFALGAWTSSPRALQSPRYTLQEPEYRCSLLPCLSQDLVCPLPPALLRDPSLGLTTISLGPHHFSGLQQLVLTSLGQGLSAKARRPLFPTQVRPEGPRNSHQPQHQQPSNDGRWELVYKYPSSLPSA